ncbi:MAG: nuclear transport factor 2 family protein [Actinomycetota bacterium]|nr:nuclear transport factor 2 family protein [Actinomycetota bacterium]
MSQENVEIVRRAYEESYAQRSVEPTREFASDDFRFHARADFPGQTSYGIDEMTKLWSDMDETYSEYSLKAEEFVDHGDYVLVSLAQSARLRGSETRVESAVYHVWEVREGKVIAAWGFSDRAEALEAVGLREWAQPSRDTARAMSQENVEAMRVAFDRFQQGDETWIDAFSEDITWDISNHPLPDWPLTGSGRDEYLSHLAAYLSSWTDYRSELRELLDADEHVVAVIHETIRVPTSDNDLERDLVQVLTVRNGRVVHVRVYPSRAEALEAVGLRE